tara:strand:- start:43971 stop:45140 length:1170 start_codon:yes stop_codon:yes gene_type:complete
MDDVDANILYLDYMASTPMCEEALHTYVHVGETCVYNAQSAHVGGIQASGLIQEAKNTLLDIVDARTTHGLIFLSSATRANYRACGSLLPNTTVYMTKTEHSSMLSAGVICSSRVKYVPCDSYGAMNLTSFCNMLQQEDPDTKILVTLMHVNNELGTINHIYETAYICSTRPNTWFHVDASQSFCKLPLKLSMPNANGNGRKKSHIHMLTISGHKIHGPKGIGALIYDTDMVMKHRFIGTPDTPAMCSFAAAARSTHEDYSNIDMNYIHQLRRRLLWGLMEKTDLKIRANYDAQNSENSVPWCVNLFLKDIFVDDLIQLSDGVIFSAGSACNSQSRLDSHVLAACGYEPHYSRQCARLSFDPIGANEEFIDDIIYRLVSNIDLYHSINA